MKRLIVALALIAQLAVAASISQSPRVSRLALAAVEKKFDNTIPALDVSDPYDLLGTTRGIYLPGYGVIFTTELNLVFTTISPFVPALTRADVEKLHAKKLGRVVSLKRYMRDMLVTAAAALDGVPPTEQIVIGVRFSTASSRSKTGCRAS